MLQNDGPQAQLAAIDAVVDLREARDAYRALATLLASDLPHSTPPLQMPRDEFGALMRVLNGRFGEGLERAEKAVRQCLGAVQTLGIPPPGDGSSHAAAGQSAPSPLHHP